jgi:hypothetical protein
MKEINKRTKTCPTCGENFSYEVGKGMDRKHCSSMCRINHKKVRAVERFKLMPFCKVVGCGMKANRISAGLCEHHYMRLRRKGTTEIDAPKYRYITGAGYIKVLLPGHPLGDKKGNVYEHRKVLYDKHGDGEKKCFWCGISLTWETCKVDHLNENKKDNSPDNLVMSCNNCNRARGAMIPFIKKLNAESFNMLVDVCRKQILGDNKDIGV